MWPVAVPRALYALLYPLRLPWPGGTPSMDHWRDAERCSQLAILVPRCAVCARKLQCVKAETHGGESGDFLHVFDFAAIGEMVCVVESLSCVGQHVHVSRSEMFSLDSRGNPRAIYTYYYYFVLRIRAALPYAQRERHPSWLRSAWCTSTAVWQARSASPESSRRETPSRRR